MLRNLTSLLFLTFLAACSARLGVKGNASGTSTSGEEGTEAETQEELPGEQIPSDGGDDSTQNTDQDDGKKGTPAQNGGQTDTGTGSSEPIVEAPPAPDTTPPVVSTIDRSMVSSGATITWPPATDNESEASNLSYLVLYSDSDVFSTIDSAMAGATPYGAAGLGDNTFFSGTTTVTLEGLTFATTYWITVVVKDAAGNIAMYPPVSGTTQYKLDDLEVVKQDVFLKKETGEFGPLEPTTLGNKIIFVGNTGQYGWQMFATDGTTAGTRHLPVLLPYDSRSVPTLLHATDNLVFFTAARQGTGQSLFRTDGTPAGTWPLFTGGETVVSGYITGPAMFTANNLAFVSTSDRIWRSDGTQSGTFPLQTSDGQNITDLVGVASTNDGKVIILADKVYLSDGTSAGTTIVSSVRPWFEWFSNFGTCGGRFCSNNMKNWARIGDQIFFAADDGLGDVELYKYDGAGSVTRLLDLTAGGSSNPVNFMELNGQVVFSITGSELWKTDGTPGGTVILNAIDHDLRFYRVAGSYLYYYQGTQIFRQSLTPGDQVPIYTETDYINTVFPFGNGVIIEDDGRLHRFDQTDGSITFLGNFGIIDGDQQPNTFAMLNGKLYFGSADLAVTDGTPAGTVSVANLFNISMAPKEYLQIGNRLVFPATDAAAGIEPHTTDGTSAGTSMLMDVTSGLTNSRMFGGLAWGTTTALFIKSGATDRIFTSDGTGLTPVATGTFRFSATNLPVPINSDLFIPMGEPSYLTPGGTLTQIQDLYGSGNSNPSTAYSLGDRVAFRYFNGSDRVGLATSSSVMSLTGMMFPTYFFANSTTLFAMTESELRVSDFTSNFVVLKNINASGSDFINPVGMVNDRFVFSAYDSASGFELWSSDGTGANTLQIADLSPGNASTIVLESVIFHNHAYILVNTGGQISLVRTNGTPGHMEVVKQVGTQSWMGQMRVLNNRLVFMEYTQNNTFGIWMGDGTANGTHFAGSVENLNNAVAITPVFMKDDLLVLDIYTSDDRSQLYRMTIK